MRRAGEMNAPLQHSHGNLYWTLQNRKVDEIDRKGFLKLFNLEKHFPFWEQNFLDLAVAFKYKLSQKIFISSLIFHSSTNVQRYGEGKAGD